jgi:hypothetical protein
VSLSTSRPASLQHGGLHPTCLCLLLQRELVPAPAQAVSVVQSCDSVRASASASSAAARTAAVRCARASASAASWKGLLLLLTLLLEDTQRLCCELCCWLAFSATISALPRRIPTPKRRAAVVTSSEHMPPNCGQQEQQQRQQLMVPVRLFQQDLAQNVVSGV